MIVCDLTASITVGPGSSSLLRAPEEVVYSAGK